LREAPKRKQKQFNAEVRTLLLIRNEKRPSLPSVSDISDLSFMSISDEEDDDNEDDEHDSEFEN